jgi:hypothetical protein
MEHTLQQYSHCNEGIALIAWARSPDPGHGHFHLVLILSLGLRLLDPFIVMKDESLSVGPLVIRLSNEARFSSCCQ